MLGVRRPSLVRQMAFRQDSMDSDLAIRHSHLTANINIPDSPRPVKDEQKGDQPTSPLTLTMPVPTKPKNDTPIRLDSIVLEEKK